jgi:hypothetical protein
MIQKYGMLAVLLACTMNLARAAGNSASCQLIADTYSACAGPKSPPFEIVNGDFIFHVQNKTVSVPCSDGVTRNFYDRADNMDIASILSIPYRAGVIKLPGSTEPGRLRSEALLMAVYGDSPASVSRNLRRVRFLNTVVTFNRASGAAAALEDAGLELDNALKTDPALAAQMAAWGKTSYSHISRGTYNWRIVAGTPRLSAHSFAMAIDFIPVEKNLPDYWRWGPVGNKPEEQVGDFPLPPRISAFPVKMIEIMEHHGFIWGAKWHHFDSMHFEYRPEFFGGLISRRCG